MFRWLKRLMGNSPVVNTVNIHITGELKLNYEGRPEYPVAPSQGSIDSSITSKISPGVGGGPQAAEPDIRPELFADTGTPEVSFGINVEEPPKRTPDKDR